MADPSGVEAQLAEYRSLRRELEQAILPLAGSVDGRRFSLQASLHGLAFETGGYVVLESDDGGRRFGQVLSLAPATVPGRMVAGAPAPNSAAAPLRTSLAGSANSGRPQPLEFQRPEWESAEPAAAMPAAAGWPVVARREEHRPPALAGPVPSAGQ